MREDQLEEGKRAQRAHEEEGRKREERRQREEREVGRGAQKAREGPEIEVKAKGTQGRGNRRKNV